MLKNQYVTDFFYIARIELIKQGFLIIKNNLIRMMKTFNNENMILYKKYVISNTKIMSNQK